MRIFKKKSKLSIEVIGAILVALVLIGGYVYFYPKTVEASWFDTSWSFRKAITLTNNTGSTQNNTQVSFTLGTASLISSGKLQSDCDDIRVTNSKGELLTYWLEYCDTTGTNNSVIWATVDSIPTGTSTIYVYYGNPSATKGSTYSSFPTGINPGTGNDGDITVSATKTIDSDTIATGRSYADAASWNITTSIAAAATTITLPSTPNGLAVGDEILIINLRGTSTNYSNVGQYETRRITAIATNTLTLNQALTNSYDGTTQKIMVQRIPQYGNVTVSSTGSLTVSAYNNTNGVGGVLFFRATGTVNVNSSGSITAAGKGYAGGIGSNPATGGATYNGTGGTGGADAGNGVSGQGGGGGMGRNASTAGSGTLGGSGGAGGFFTGGGGGGGYGAVGTTTGTASSGSDTTGGTGGSNNSPAYGDSGGGGGTYGSADLSTLYLGSGGGGGADGRTYGALGGDGGPGGGVIFIGATTLTVTGTISSNGSNGNASAAGSNRGGGGGGAGGSILIKATTATLGSSLLISSGGTGGTGGTTVGKNGGAGGVGRIATDYSTSSGTTSPAAGSTSVLVVSGTVASEEVGSGPAAYWNFDQSQGQTVNDSTSNKNNGTLGASAASSSDDPSWTTEDQCVAGKCLKFDGGDYVSRISTDSLQITTDISVGAWVYINSTGTEQTILGKWDETTGTDDRSYRLWIDSNNKLNFSLSSDGTSGNTTTVTGNTSLTANKWYYLSGVGDVGTSIKVYIDGKEDGSNISGNPSSISDNQSTLYIGGKENTSGSVDTLLNGRIDEVKIYPYARSQAQIAADYNSRSSLIGSSAQIGSQSEKILSDGLVGYWKMDEASANTCTGGVNDSCDSSGNSNNGAWNGDATSAAGKFGNGVTFDGNGDNVLFSGSVYTMTGNTVVAWVKSTDTRGFADSSYKVPSNPIASSNINSGGSAQFWSMGMVSGKAHTLLDSSTGNGSGSYGHNVTPQLTGTSTINDGLWHQIVWTVDSLTNSNKLFVDGKLEVQDTLHSEYTSMTEQFKYIGGNNWWGGVQSFNGSLDDVRIYNRALSPAEVSQLYNFAPGPVGYWDFEDGKGNTVADKSNNGYTGTWYGTGLHWANGKYGKAGKFSTSTGDYIYTSALSTSHAAPQNFTISYWMNPDTVSVEQHPVETGWSDFRLNAYATVYNANGTTVSKNTYPQTAAPWVANTWQYVTLIWDGSTARLYKNGVQIDSTTGSGTVTNVSCANGKQVWIGKFNSCGAVPSYNGLLDEVKIYNYARTPDQIIEDMNGGHPAVGTPVGSAVAHWSFDEGYGTSANDQSINKNTITLSSASWTTSGKFNKAWNGTGALWLSRADDSDFDFSATEDFATSLWFKSDSATNPGATEYLFNKANATTAGYAIYANTSGNLCFGIDDDTTWGPDVGSCTTSDFYDNSWHHLVGVRNTTLDKTYIYIDGILRDSDTDSTTETLANSLSLYLGDRDGVDNGDEFNGDLDEVKIYRFALTTDEVKTEYNRGSSMVLGAISDNSTAGSKLASSQKYCIPGDTSTCTAPVGEWDFEEGKGGSVNDSSGNGNTGTWNGTGTKHWDTGKIGKAGKFNGSDDYVEIANNSSLNFGSSTDFTLMGWLKFTDSGDSNGQQILSKQDGNQSPYQGYRVFKWYGKIEVNLQDTDGTTLTWGDSGATRNDNKWHHFAFTADRDGNGILYIDGRVIESRSITSIGNLDDTTMPLRIGRWASAQSNSMFNGSIDQIRVFNYARTPAQIAWDYNQGEPVGYWDMDECQGTTIHDSSPNKNNGTLTIGASGTQTAPGTCSSSGTTPWYSGRSGHKNSSVNFDGTDDKVTIGTAITGVQSVAFWVKPTTSSDSFIDLDGGTHYITSSSGVVSATGFTSPTTYVNGVSGGTVTGNAWNHIVVTTATSFNSTTSFTLGYKAAATADYLTGQLDEVKVFNYALTGTQVKELFNDGAIKFGQ